MNGDRQGELKQRLKALQKQQAWALESESARHLQAMVGLARSEPGVAVAHSELDADPWLLNCANGTLDLRTGLLGPHAREALITKLCPTAYDPDAVCDLWVETLTIILGGRPALVEYLQRLCGYCLTGDVREAILPIFWGGGSNGKSLFFEIVRRVLGNDYAGVGSDDLLLSGGHLSHPTGLADLFGKRLVTLAETREDGRINEVLVKKLTGGDRIKARRMKENFWEFDPTHKIWLATNHKPEVKGTDHGIWRRLRLIPFTVRFWDPDKGEDGPLHLKADKTLKDRLALEAPGILAWMVRGCLEWQAGGLREPGEVLAATREYRDEQDTLASFLREGCVQGAALRCRAADLYKVYRDWHEAAGEQGKPMSLRRLGEAVQEKGFVKKTSNGVWYLGVAPIKY